MGRRTEKSDMYLMLDAYLLQVKTIQRLCSHNHNLVEAEAGYEEIWSALDKAAEKIREKMQEIRYGAETVQEVKPWQSQIMRGGIFDGQNL